MERSHPVFLLLLGLTVAALENQASDSREPLKITIGPEIRVFPDGLQPFMFLSRNGVVVVQAQLPLRRKGIPRTVAGSILGSRQNLEPLDAGSSSERGSLHGRECGAAPRRHRYGFGVGGPRTQGGWLFHRKALGVARRMEDAFRTNGSTNLPAPGGRGI